MTSMTSRLTPLAIDVDGEAANSDEEEDVEEEDVQSSDDVGTLTTPTKRRTRMTKMPKR